MGVNLNRYQKHSCLRNIYEGQRPFFLKFLYGNLVAAVFIALAACQSIPRLPAGGQWHGHPLNTTVDSQAALDYLQAFHAPPSPNSEALKASFAQARQQVASAGPKLREALFAVAQQHSVDVAALVAADHWLGLACHQAITQNLAQRQAALAAAPALPDQALPGANQYVMLFVPGWDYAANGAQTGSDFALQRRLATRHGFDNQLVPLASTGGVEENAQTVAQAVRAQAQAGKAVVLVGASSGGPAIHLALVELLSASERQAVKAWLNLGGIVQGSPLVEYLPGFALRLVAWYNGWSVQAIRSLGAPASRARFAGLTERLDLTREMLVINYLGIPLSGQISRLAEHGYGPLRAHGPNDGLALLPDMLLPHAPTIIALGSDHFLGQHPQVETKTVAMMAMLLDALQQGRSLRCD
jgi:hypothetical protein